MICRQHRQHRKGETAIMRPVRYFMVQKRLNVRQVRLNLNRLSLKSSSNSLSSKLGSNQDRTNFYKKRVETFERSRSKIIIWLLWNLTRRNSESCRIDLSVSARAVWPIITFHSTLSFEDFCNWKLEFCYLKLSLESMADTSLIFHYFSHQRFLFKTFFFIPTTLALITTLVILVYISITSHFFFAHHHHHHHHRHQQQFARFVYPKHPPSPPHNVSNDTHLFLDLPRGGGGSASVSQRSARDHWGSSGMWIRRLFVCGYSLLFSICLLFHVLGRWISVSVPMILLKYLFFPHCILRCSTMWKIETFDSHGAWNWKIVRDVFWKLDIVIVCERVKFCAESVFFQFFFSWYILAYTCGFYMLNQGYWRKEWNLLACIYAAEVHDKEKNVWSFVLIRK